MTDRHSNSGGGSHDDADLAPIKPVAHNHTFLRQIAGRPDAETLAAEHAAKSWDAVNGEALREAELKAAKSRIEADKAQADADKADTQAKQTEQYEVGAHVHDKHGSPQKVDYIPLSEWKPYDRIMVVLLALTAAILLMLGGVNVAVTILASGIPAFLDAPWLAYLLGALVPAISMAIKSGYYLCKLDAQRHRYALVMFVAAGVTALIWIVLFGLSFEGASGDFDYDAMLTEVSGHNYADTFRTITQILCEILIGASLFLTIDTIFSRYSSDHISERVGWRELRGNADTLFATADLLSDIANTDEAVASQFRAGRELHIAEAVAFLRDV